MNLNILKYSDSLFINRVNQIIKKLDEDEYLKIYFFDGVHFVPQQGPTYELENIIRWR